ncbi:MAG: energy transducer TonB [Acidobacteriota bacterium]
MNATSNNRRMQEAPHEPSANAPSRGLLAISEHPAEVHFLFEQRQSRVGVLASIGSHLAVALIIAVVLKYAPEPIRAEIEQPPSPDGIIWLAEPGPGGGGGGGGNENPEPPKPAELPGKEKITVPVERPPEITPPKDVEDIPPLEALNIPARTLASAEVTLPGAIESANVSSISQGAGTGGGAGTGTGTGIGSGQGSGLGPGFGGGTGGGAYRPGAGITVPRVVREVKPQYTADAMRAKVQGTVWVECIVLPDGTVGDVRVTRSLDPVFGLDQEAVRAAREWRFIPGTKDGEPVPVIVTIELTFTLR